jgi:hypothetical protein
VIVAGSAIVICEDIRFLTQKGPALGRASGSLKIRLS